MTDPGGNPENRGSSRAPGGVGYEIVELRRRLDDGREIAAGAPYAGRGALMCLAIPGRVVQLVDEPNRLAQVDVGGVLRNVNVGLLNGVAPGDWVLIHVGFALSTVDEKEAQATLRLLQEMGAAYEQELEELKASVID